VNDIEVTLGLGVQALVPLLLVISIQGVLSQNTATFTIISILP
jgi:hypothetical protein